MNKISDLEPKEIVSGITGRYVHGENQTYGYVEIKAGSKLPEHHHRHEQITYMLDGQLDMLIGGNRCIMTAGTYSIIPSDIPHSAVAVTDCRVTDIFSPAREDYK